MLILSASVERFGVSRMQDFHQIGPLGGFGLVVEMSVYIYIYFPFTCDSSRGAKEVAGEQWRLRANERPQKILHQMAQTDRHPDRQTSRPTERWTWRLYD